MSVAEIKEAVKTLSPEELAEISAFIAGCEADTWDRQIDLDCSEGGRLHSVMEEVRTDLRAGRLDRLPIHFTADYADNTDTGENAET